MKGKKVCFVDPSSTSGYLFPSYNLLEAGIDPEKDITPVFAGKHDVSVQKVGEGVECDAGFAEDSEVEKSDAVEVIDQHDGARCPASSYSRLAARRRQEAAERRPVRRHDRPDHRRRASKSADSDAFRSVFYATTPVDDAYYDLIRDICKKTERQAVPGLTA